MTNKPESAEVEAVAECVTGGGIDRLPAGQGLRPGTKLYPQSALDALRGEVERARVAGIDACDKLTTLWQKDIDRADAAERRVADLELLLDQTRYWVGDDSEFPAELRLRIEAALTKESP